MNCLKQFDQYLISLNADRSNQSEFDISGVIETIFGKIRISIHKSDFTKTGKPRKKYGNLISIFARFEDVDRAKDYLKANDGNIYSGKYNFHLSGGDDEIDNWNICFQRFKRVIEQLKT